MGADSPTPVEKRTVERFDIEINASNESCFSKYKKPIIAGVVILVVLLVLFLSLGLTGVFDGTKIDPPVRPTDSTTTDSTTTPTSTTVLVPIEVANVPLDARLDCSPDRNLTEEDCWRRGCSFEVITGNSMVPSCFVHPNETGYTFSRVTNARFSDNVEIYDLEPVSGRQLYSAPFVKPQLKLERKSNSILRLTFGDAGKERYAVPVPLQPLKDTSSSAPLYDVVFSTNRINGLQVIRNSTGTKVWDLSLGGLFLEDQFLQIATKLPSTYVYGFGDNRHPRLRHTMDWKTWPMFSRDEAPNDPNRQANLYGVHPFYMCVEDDSGNTHGVLLLNSNAMEYTFQPAPALTLRSIGGVLDFYLFFGPSPENVIQQYTELLGRSFLPPYWALGFQISRWGFKNLTHVKTIVDRNVALGIPLDAVYGDIDYMRHRQDFTYDEVKYAGLPAYVDELHQRNMRYVIILDPAIHADAATKHPHDPPYKPYIQGVEQDVFVKWPQSLVASVDQQSVGNKNTMFGKVWPDGRSAFPDFFKTSTLHWWEDMINETYNVQKIKFDALWIDMNEPASFDTNDKASEAWYCIRPWELPGNHTCFALQCPKNNSLEVPPYRPAAVRVWDGTKPYPTMLSEKSLCMVAEHEINGKPYSHYDVHSLYGWSQAEVTYRAAQAVRKERSFVFSRSTYPGAQQYVGHWLGDNRANFAELRQSIVGLLEYSMFGYAYVGADLCGFFGDTTTELCTRWSTAGAFYPFARNHNHNLAKEQDPAHDPVVAAAAKKALLIRYTLLPYLYTLFYRAHVFGDTVSRPLHHVFPKDLKARDIDDQFFWGPALMISPILDNVSERQVYVPEEHFYNYYDGHAITPGTVNFTWGVKDEIIPLYLRCGYIIPTQDPSVTTAQSRNNPFRLMITVDAETPVANGELFWDDGQSIDTYEIGNYYLAEFSYSHVQQALTYTVKHNAGPKMTHYHLDEIKIFSKDLPMLNDLLFVLDGVEAAFSISVADNSSVSIQGHFPMDRSFTFQFLPRGNFEFKGIDCFPEGSPTRTACEARGCAFEELLALKYPACTYSRFETLGYKQNKATILPVSGHNDSKSTWEISPALTASQVRPGLIPRLAVSVQAWTNKIVRVTLQDADNVRYQVPCQLAPFACDNTATEISAQQYDYKYTDKGNTTTLQIVRRSNGAILWDTDVGALIYANQYIEISTRLPSKDVYGLGEHTRNSFRHDLNYHTWGMFARDQPTGGSQNLYGVHPYVMVVEEDGRAFGSLLLSSNAMEVQFSPEPAMTYRTTGGILDFFLLVGDRPADVNQIYIDMIGKPFLPPYWALGFQISRYGYNTFENMRAAIERTRTAEIPLDVFYGDIDYFEGNQNFIISEERFGALPEYVRNMSAEGLRFVTILDPCIAADQNNAPFKRGLEANNVFIRWPKGYAIDYPDYNAQAYRPVNDTENPYLLGLVWPNEKTVFVDFFHPNASEWWKNEVHTFHEKIPFSGLWIDMNEPANFGTNGDDIWYTNPLHGNWSLKCPEGEKYPLEDPPYKPRFITGKRISDKTICMSAVQNDGKKSYSHSDVHSLYGHSQIEPSLHAIESATGKRSFVVGRSTFPGSGSKAGHWLGDNKADWNHLRQSVIGMLEFNMFGIPYVGADICGFDGDTTEELCARWMQLGAFYPFSRNHNGKGFVDQDPLAVSQMVAHISKHVMETRYRLLPYLYTLFADAHAPAAMVDHPVPAWAQRSPTVVRSLMEEFPDDKTARGIDKQFMWGDCLLVTPVLEEGASTVVGYVPTSRWFDFNSGTELHASGEWSEFNASLAMLNVPLHVRGGCILPMQEPGRNTKDSLKNPYSLWVAPSSINPTVAENERVAQGLMYWDGGEDREGSNNGQQYFASYFYVFGNDSSTGSETYHWRGILALTIAQKQAIQTMPKLDNIIIAGYPTDVPWPTSATVEVDGESRDVTSNLFFDSRYQVLTFSNMGLDVNKDFVLTFQNFHDSHDTGLIDCYTENPFSTKAQCEARGCVWNENNNGTAPVCYYSEWQLLSIGYQQHTDSIVVNSNGKSTRDLVSSKYLSTSGLHDDLVHGLRLVIEPLSSKILRITLKDAGDDSRYTVPCSLAPFACNVKADSSVNSSRLYDYRIIENGFTTSVQVVRKSTGAVLWDTSVGGLVYSNKYLEISTRLPSKDVYGLGEHTRNSFRHDLGYKKWSMFARDQQTGGSQNLYGVHPYVMVVEEDGNAFGSLLLNSNAMEVEFSPMPSMTYRTTGGILDFFLFIGNQPADVNQLYIDMIGKPFLPPYWALGFQISRYGYNNFTNMQAAVERTLAAEIPLDVFYGDIDYFEDNKNFLVSQERFAELPAYVRNKLADGLRFVTILDPCIAADPNYAPFQRGLSKQNVFIRWSDSYIDTNNQSYRTINSTQPPYLLGKVWPTEKTVFADFLNPETKTWWKEEVRLFHEEIPFSALWIDMNEPANFGTNENVAGVWSLKCPEATRENPAEYSPHKPFSISGRTLSDKTICMSAVQNNGNKTYNHYDVHSLYGHSQTEPTLSAIEAVTGKRGFVIGRSTFVGSGSKAGHWLGDNTANWNQLRQSIIGMLEFNMFGIPYVGADICGYFDDTTEELCTRWMQVGAFYPFSRNHNGKDFKDQDPAALGAQVISASKSALNLRYRLLPYLYTLFADAHAPAVGAHVPLPSWAQRSPTVVRSLMEEFPNDKTARAIDRQFMWGDCLLITPVLDQGALNVTGYFPKSRWFDFTSGSELFASEQHKLIPADLNTVPLHVRGGCILPLQEPGKNTQDSLKNPYSLWVAPISYDLAAANNERVAQGSMFWDGGEDLEGNIGDGKNYLASYFYVFGNDSSTGTETYHWRGVLALTTLSRPPASLTESMPKLDNIIITGYPTDVPWPTSAVVEVDGQAIDMASHMTFDSRSQVIIFNNLGLDVNKDFILTFQNFHDSHDRGLIDCYTENPFPTKAVCESRGCTWDQANNGSAPVCYHSEWQLLSTGYKQHTDNVGVDSNGKLTRHLTSSEYLSTSGLHVDLVHGLQLVIEPLTSKILRITLKDAGDNTRYTVPCSLAPFACNMRPDESVNSTRLYDYRLIENGYTTSIQVIRKSTGAVLWDTSVGGLIFSNTYLELSTRLPSKNVYGLGEHTRNSFRHDLTYKKWAMFARDQPTGGSQNLYGVHPYVMVVEEDGNAFGSLLLNSNAMEVEFSPMPSMTYRTTGGILDFFLFIGNQPADVNQLYIDMIGKPFLPPYWALGFQISRYGYNNFTNMQAAVERTLAAEIPLDVFYGDIDYFEDNKNFLVSQERFAELPAYVRNKSTDGLRFVTILDPCIAADPNYAPFQRGLSKQNVFIRWSDSYIDTNNQSYRTLNDTQPPYLLGKVWPTEKTVFADFLHPDAKEWWIDEIRRFHEKIPFSALWIDMNEPANFGTNEEVAGAWSLKCPANTPENPAEFCPHKPFSISGRTLSDKTICMSAVQNNGNKTYNHFDVHSLYGHSQTEPTLSAIEAATGKRSFVIGRSTFVGSGRKAGHWLGDNTANWNQLRQSIIGMLEFNMFGIPYVGADICGYFEDTSDELCARWMQVGAFYPFSRNHNGKDFKDQDPAALGNQVIIASRIALTHRYRLLPYLYTLFGDAHAPAVGAHIPLPVWAQRSPTVVRSLMEEYPYDKVARGIDRQFMWGDCLLITPVLDEGAQNVTGYFPKSRWFDFVSGSELLASEEYKLLPADLYTIPLHVRGGCILPMQEPGKNTKESLKNPYSLWVAPNSQILMDSGESLAEGSMYWDGGEDREGDGNTNGLYLGHYFYSFGRESETSHKWRGVLALSLISRPSDALILSMPKLNNIMIAGYPRDVPWPRSASIEFITTGETRDISSNMNYNSDTQVINFVNLQLDVNKDFIITFHGHGLVDCFPENSSPSKQDCEKRGCTWNNVTRTPLVPVCSYPDDQLIGYKQIVSSVVTNSTTGGSTRKLVSTSALNSSDVRPNLIRGVQLVIQPLSSKILRITLKDSDDATRYTVPCSMASFACNVVPDASASLESQSYETRLIDNGNTTTIQVLRRNTATVLWDTNVGGLILSNQYLEISTRLPSKDVYGLGEHTRDSFRHDLNYRTWGMFARDQPTGGSQNLYGVHPYVMVVEEDGQAFGSLLLSSNAMEVQFSPYPAMTYRTTGGILDFFLFIGTQPADVNQLYIDTIGKPFLPPYWALGFQISRYGYNNFQNMQTAVERTLAAEIPLDVFYGDIDYFEDQRNFIISNRFGELPAYVRTKLADGLRFVTILDPCIAADPTYAPFQRGLAKTNTFISWPHTYVDTTNVQSYRSLNASSPPYLLGMVWPSEKTVFADFLNPEAREWWKEEVRIFHEKIPFSALWIDMNEPANFGTDGHDLWYNSSIHGKWSLKCPSGPEYPLEDPPYKPNAISGVRLSDKTICMSAIQNDGVRNYNHYDVHSLYGHSQIEPSLSAMESVTGKRSFVFGRSTFPGSGSKAGHWLGDNHASWQHLRQSIIGILEFNMFGIPYVGADICGYGGNTTTELCARWMQVGAFYPFSRNHNGKDNLEQDPAALGPDVLEASKRALRKRYLLLPFLYTLLADAHTPAVALHAPLPPWAQRSPTVVRSLMEEFPDDKIARGIDRQFMWGDCILITPVLEEGSRSVSGYFPNARWFELITGSELHSSGAWKDIPADLHTIPVHVRGGCILPMQEPGNNTKLSLKNPYHLWVAPTRVNPNALSNERIAEGPMYWDGGEATEGNSSINGNYLGHYLYVFGNDSLTGNSTSHWRGVLALTILSAPSASLAQSMPKMDHIVIAGYAPGAPAPFFATVEVGKNITNVSDKMLYDAENNVVIFDSLGISVTEDFVLTFQNY